MEKTVISFNGINDSTQQYVSSLSEIKTTLDEIIKQIGKNYENKVSEFEKDRHEIFESSKKAIKGIEEATNNITKLLASNANLLQKKLTYILILNIIIIAGIIAAIFLK